MSKIYYDSKKAWELWGPTSDMQEIAESVFNRIDDEEVKNEDDLYDAIMSELDNELFYYYQQWAILEFYCLPKEANYDEAIEEFINDLFNVIKFKQEEEE